MRIVADSGIPAVVELCGHLGEVQLLSSAEMTPAALRKADVLIVRSEIRIDRELLEGSRVRFVGTATSGLDHLDFEFLQEAGITVANAGGGNSNAVAEYVIAALLRIGSRDGVDLGGKTLGVVGVGLIGSRVVRAARILGMNVLLNDPPLAERGAEGDFVDLDVLADADFVTVHVPLTRTGPHPTFRLFDRARLKRLKRSAYLINTSRGAVIDEQALKAALRSGRLAGAVLDVWEGEPIIDLELLGLTTLGTSHIAGYSLDGKLKSTLLIYEALCRWLGVDPEHRGLVSRMLTSVRRTVDLTGTADPLVAVTRAVAESYPIDRDDQRLRELAALSVEERGRAFRALRSHYDFRFEFSHTRVICGQEGVADMLAAIGFSVGRA